MMRPRWRSPGDRGTAETLHRMRRIARRQSTDLPLVMVARQVVLEAGQRDRPEAVRVIRRWLRRHTKFVPDPVGAEYLVGPRNMLEGVARHGVAAGDCDDVAMLGAALARAVGIPTRLTAVAFDEDTPYRHVFAEAHDGDDWREFDVGRPAGTTAQIRRALTLGV